MSLPSTVASVAYVFYGKRKPLLARSIPQVFPTMGKSHNFVL
ncbi:hypothetical protein [Polynucleobacter finlandensis]|nr:hypothetical protein [Polynucleobacter finlandensis]